MSNPSGHQSHETHVVRGLSAASSETIVLRDVHYSNGRPDPSQRRSLLELLRFSELGVRECHINPEHDRTCRWLFYTPQYASWRAEPCIDWRHRLFWIKGNPGAGKSTLMRFAPWETQKSLEDELVLTHFFNAKGDWLEHSAEGMYRTLLYRLLEWLPEQSLEELESLFKHHDENRPWTIPELVSMLKAALERMADRPVAFYIDALDECPEDEIRQMLRVFRNIVRDAWSSGKQVRVCLASRPYPFIAFKDATFLDLGTQEGHLEDLEQYVKDMLYVDMSPLAKETQRSVMRKAAGCFMWVVLVVQTLNAEYDSGKLDKLSKRLRDVPLGMYELYREIFERFPGDNDILLACCQWLIAHKELVHHPDAPSYSVQHLWWATRQKVDRDEGRTRNLYNIMSAEQIERSIIEFSKGLVEIRSDNYGIRRPQFVHESVRDFILNSDHLRGLRGGQDSQRFVALSQEALRDGCFSVLKSEQPTMQNLAEAHGQKIPGEVIRDLWTKPHNGKLKHPFAEYAATSVMIHAEEAQRLGLDQTAFLEDFIKHCGPYFLHPQDVSNLSTTRYVRALHSAADYLAVTPFQSGIGHHHLKLEKDFVFRAATQNRVDGLRVAEKLLADKADQVGDTETDAGSSHPSASLTFDYASFSAGTAYETTVVTSAAKRPGLIEDNDAATIYSGKSIAGSIQQGHLNLFASRLLEDLPESLDMASMDLGYLDSILRAFAWKLHSESTNVSQRETSIILSRGRRDVLNKLLGPKPGSIDASSQESTEDTQRELFLRRNSDTLDWLDNVKSSPFEWESDDKGGVHFEAVAGESQEKKTKSQNKYEEFISTSVAYRWLISEIQRSLQQSTDLVAMEDISQSTRDLFSAVSSQGMSSRRPMPNVELTFQLEWNPRRILLEQELISSTASAKESFTLGSDPLSQLMCITGTPHQAYATTIEQYLSETWPHSWEPLYNLVRKLVSHVEGEIVTIAQQYPQRSNQVSDTPYLQAQLEGPSACWVRISGGLYDVSEVAAQLAWLSSAVRRAPINLEAGINMCTPSIIDLRLDQLGKSTIDKPLSGHCSIRFAFDIYKTPGPPAEGCCWHNLFQNVILVTGYPVQRRPNDQAGLELSLPLMTHLVRSPQVIELDQQIMIKGFNLLLAVVKVTLDTVVWHLWASKDPGTRISYNKPHLLEAKSDTPVDLLLTQLQTSRHIIGWCPAVENKCGHKRANISLRTSGLGCSPGHTVIDRLYLEYGPVVLGGVNAAINVREQPQEVQRQSDYPYLLDWISTQPIVLYDAIECRAWLLDGASALLHLIRVSIALDQGKAALDFVFNPEDLRDQWEGSANYTSALSTLRNWDNLRLRLYVTNERIAEPTNDNATRGNDPELIKEYYTFRDRAVKLIHMLQALIDRQSKVAIHDGVAVKQTFDFRTSIQGFDVMDVIDPRKAFFPREKCLESVGPGWSHLVKAIGALVVFGNGFGDLLQVDDRARSAICSRWHSVPHGEHYMAVSRSTLRFLYANHLERVEPSLSSGNQAKRIRWSRSYFARAHECSCRLNSEAGSAMRPTAAKCKWSPVQVLTAVEDRWWNINTSSEDTLDVTSLTDEGAIILGHKVTLTGRKKSQRVVAELSENEAGEHHRLNVTPSHHSATVYSSSSRVRSEEFSTPAQTSTVASSVGIPLQDLAGPSGEPSPGEENTPSTAGPAAGIEQHVGERKKNKRQSLLWMLRRLCN